MLSIVKQALRITSSAYDGEIQLLIDACKAEIANNNVDLNNESLLTYYQLAVINFCKAHFGNNPDSEKFLKIYESLKTYLMGLNRGLSDG